MSSHVEKPPKERLKILFDQGGMVEVNINVPVQRYFRSGQEMMRMANIYYEEKQYESAYLLFAKFITLFLEKLKNHPQFKQAPPSAKAANKSSLKTALSRAEKIKSVLEEKYEIEYMRWKTEQENKKRVEEERQEYQRIQEEEKKRLEANARLDQEKQQLDYFVEQQRRKKLEEERLEIESRFAAATDLKDESGGAPLIPVDFAPPPSLPTPVAQPRQVSTQPAAISQERILPPPTVDRSIKPQHLVTPIPQEPSVNNTHHVPHPSDTHPTIYSGEAISSTVTISKNKYGLRTVVSPQDLPAKFMQYAKSNNLRNIETCGVLFGNLSQNMFVITHVLLPHQCGTSESCSTTREEDLWEFQEEYDGICLGWIHTHPSQTAFLSSVDLHTHYPYQCLMAESVAIVCSGKYKETGYFMITPGQGMRDIGNCSKPGHHPHQTVPPLFETCDHVHVSDSHTVQFVDWRKR